MSTATKPAKTRVTKAAPSVDVIDKPVPVKPAKVDSVTAIMQEAIAAAEARQAEAEKAREAKAKADRMRREALLAEKAKQDALDKQKELANQVRSFVEKFMLSVASHGEKNNWKPGGVAEAFEYAKQLVAQKDDPAGRRFNKEIINAVNDKFAYGLVLAMHHDNPVPEGTFWGQRQDWFPELFEKKMQQFRANKPRRS